MEADEKPFAIDRAKQGRAACKKCKQKCETGELRIAKLAPSPYGHGKMKNWHHIDCLIEQFLKQRVNTKRIESLDELDGFENLNDEDKLFVISKLNDCEQQFAQNHNLKSPKQFECNTKVAEERSDSKNNIKVSNKKSPKCKDSIAKEGNSSQSKNKDINKDDLFKEFRRLVADITNESGYLKKSKLVENMFKNGSSGDGFNSNVTLWCQLLLPGVDKRVYNLRSKQLIKLFSRMFHTKQEPMLDHLKNGDVSETIHLFFEQSNVIKPTKKSTLTLTDVDEFLQTLSTLTKEDDQIQHFTKIIPKCTTGDLKVIIRLIKQDLRMNAGAKHILDGVHPDAYEMYQSSRDLDAVIDKCLKSSGSDMITKNIEANISLMTPVLPMLAQACKSVEEAMKKCPNGMFSEIKYDGERVQVHKKGNEFRYFSRSLKPVMAHKIEHFKKYIPKAFPYAHDLILDSEILMIDTITSQPLPFGTLGVHKKSEFKQATVCLFVFDCIYYNGEDLTKKPIKTRKKILQENMKEIPNHIVFSEMEEIKKIADLSRMMKRVLGEGLEGLVLKDTLSIYEPGKRHWLKVKKDYLFDGAMADSADLIVLGAWYGTGKKGGMMSVFLMGCYDKIKKLFLTVTKVHTGLDDETLQRLQTELDMVKISCDYSKVPNWLNCSKSMIPDFVARDPKKQPVWQIIGAEFTQHDVHTADGISIRFPRIVKMRDDKDWEHATNLEELHHLIEESQRKTNLMLDDNLKTEDDKSLLDINNDTGLHEDQIEDNLNEEIDDGPKRKRKLDSPNKNIKKIKGEIEKISLKNPIPRYFDGVKLIPMDNIQNDIKIWLRYFVAYGGTVLHDEKYEEATHILHSNKESEICYKCPTLMKHVHLDWIKQTVVKKSLEDYREYPVWLQANCNELHENESL